MYLLKHFLTGLAIIHLAWAYFYLCGSILHAPRLDRGFRTRALTGGLAAVDIVLSTVTGMAITGLVTFFLGAVRAIYPVTFVLWLLLLGVAFALLGDSPLRAQFWTSRLRVLRAAIEPGFLIAYAGAICLALPASFPLFGWDATEYHYVYAFDWAQAHRIFTNIFLRFPYYANNWVLLDTWGFEFGIGEYLDFLSWLATALTSMGIYGLVRTIPRSAGGFRAIDTIVALLACAAYALNPTLFRWGDTGMVDGATGMLFLATFGAVLVIAKGREPWPLGHLVLCGAFLVGTKISFLALLPLLVAMTWTMCRLVSLPRRATIFALVLLCGLSLPWYVRNFAADGDPIAPTINIALHRPDRAWTPQDYANVMGNFFWTSDKTPGFLLKLPVDIVWNTGSDQYRELGVTLLMLVIWLPGAVLGWALLPRAKLQVAIASGAAMLVYTISYWTLTAHLARYALLFYGALAAFVAIVLLEATRRSRSLALLSVLALAVLAYPSPPSIPWVRQYFDLNYVRIAGFDRDAYLTSWIDGYPEIEYTASELRTAHRMDLRIYGIDLEGSQLYYRLSGVRGIGDWVGPERYFDFVSALKMHRLAGYLQRFSIGAVLVPEQNAYALTPPDAPGLPQALDRELKRLGYRAFSLPGREGKYRIYLAPSVSRGFGRPSGETKVG